MASLKIALIKRIPVPLNLHSGDLHLRASLPKGEKIDGLIDILRNLLRLTGI